MVLSLVAVVPAAITGAQTAGTVQLNRSVYSLADGQGTDDFDNDEAKFNVVEVKVTDADLNTLRTATARFLTPNNTTYGIGNTGALIADAIQGQDVMGETPTGAVDGTNRIFKVANTVLGDRASSTEDVEGPDGRVDTADVTVRVGGVKVDVVAIGAYTGTHDAADDAAELSDSTASFRDDGLVGGTVYNTTDGSSGPITANAATTITAELSGGDDDDWDEDDDYTITEPSGTHTGDDGQETVLTDASASFPTEDLNNPVTPDDPTDDDGLLIDGTVYNITDGSSGTITDNTATTITVGGRLSNADDPDSEDDWDTGDVYVINRAVNNAALGMVALAEAPRVGSAITVDYNFYEFDRANPEDSPINAVALVKRGDATLGVSHFNSGDGIVEITTLPAGSGTLAITFSYNLIDTISDVPISSDSTRLAGAERTIDLKETEHGSGVFTGEKILQDAGVDDDEIDDEMLQVADGDTIMVSYSDASPLGSRVDTAVVDLTAPVITLVEPENNLSTQDPTPSFTVEVTDAVAPITDADSVSLIISGQTVSAAKTNVVGGFRLSYLQASPFADGPVSWHVSAEDAVGNDVAVNTGTEEEKAYQLGSSENPFTVTVDNTSIAAMDSVKAGFGLNDAGNMRTRNDNTGIEITFNEAIDGDSVVPGDFNVVGSPDILSARHSATQRNTESTDDVLDDGEKKDAEDAVEQADAVEAKPAVLDDETTEGVDESRDAIEAADAVEAKDAIPARTVYSLTEFTPIDTNDDGNVDEDDVTATVDGDAENVLSVDGRNVTVEGHHTKTVAITYTYDSNAQVFLKVGADLDSDATPAVSLPGDLLDLAGNNAIRGLQRTASDDIAPTITVTLDADTVGDPDNNGDAEGTVTIVSSEALAGKPTLSDKGTYMVVEKNDDDEDVDVEKTTRNPDFTFGDVTNVPGTATQWTATYRSTKSADYEVTATGTDSASNMATSEAAMVNVDIDDPELVSFDPAAVEEGEDLNVSLQGLDNVIRVEADFGEETTVMSSMLNGEDVSANTFSDGNIQILALPGETDDEATEDVDEGLHTWVITVQDAAGNVSEEAEVAFMVAAPTTFTIPLEPGWNLISVPGRLDAATPGKVFGNESPSVTKVRTWNSTDGWLVSSFVPGEADDPMTEDVDESTESAWVGDILALKQGLGYWVLSATAEDVPVLLRRLAGIPAAPRAQSLDAGWNLVGPQFFNLPPPKADDIADLDADDYFISVEWSVAYGFDPDPSVGFQRIAPKSTEDNLHAGSGYWVFLTEAGELIP